MLTVSLIIPKVNKIGIKFNLIDKPNIRKQHDTEIVRVGGLAIIFAFLIAILLCAFFINTNDFLRLENFNNNLLILIISGGIFFNFIGLLDDIFNISPFLRLFFQFIVATFIWNQGISINSIYIPGMPDAFNLILYPKIISLLFTCIWIVGVTNALNWMDGLDGLASGITSITSIAIYGISIASGDLTISLISCTLAGVCFGFIFYNRHPSYILMGDCGSNFIGFMLAILTLGVSSFESNSILTANSINILLCLAILLMPLLDMSFVISKRLYLAKSPFYPDRSHLHHQILNTGISHKKTVQIMHSITTIILVFTMFYLELNLLVILLPIITFAFIYLFIELFYKYKVTKKKYF